MKIDRILAILRASKGLSQEAVANEIGVDYSTYARWESGKTEMKVSQIQLLAEMYGMTVDEILSFDPINTVKEPKEIYNRRRGISVSIDLDGSPVKLKESIDLLTKINGMVNEMVKNSAA